MDEAEVMVFKKKLKKMAQFKGKGTELISVYIPPDADRSSVMGQITEEISQSSNIKSPTTRKNVQGALKKVNGFLKHINFKIPENGLVVFAGNISEVEGRSNIKLFTVQPPQKLKTKLYWCDSEFHLAPLQEMAKPQEVFGLVTIDKNESTIATLGGKKYEIIGHFTSGVAGKQRAGGQCLEPNSLIQLSNGNIIEIHAAHNPLELKSADFEKFEINDSKIVEKWNQNKKESVKIITKNPRTEIVCSNEHLVFTANNGIIEETPASKLKINDLLVMPEKIEIKGKKQRLKTNYFNNYKILNKKGTELLIKKRKKQQLSQKKFGKIIGLHQAEVSAMERNTFNPRLSFIKKYCAGLTIDSNKFISNYCIPISKLKMPKELNADLAQFLGYLIGDGGIENERIRFYERDKETIEQYERLSKKLFNANTNLRFRNSKNYFELSVQGKPIVRLVRSEFPEIKKALDSSIPEKILKSSNYALAAFFRGLFDAEGYATTRALSLGMNNKKLIQQMQTALLRFGIIASVYEYDNRKNPYSKNPRFVLDISDNESLKLFGKKIGFSFKEKQKKLEKLIKSRKGKSYVRQIIVSGKEIRKMFEKEGFNSQRFPKVSDFFRNKRQMSKEIFKKSIMKEVKKNPKLFWKFEKILNYPFIPAKIKELKKIKKSMNLIDIKVKNHNFIANGLIVHNSAKRFEHLREEAAQDFYKRISEKVNKIFLPHNDKLKGIIIGGPGITKNYFLNKDLIDHRLKGKIIGVIDTSYTDESGIREMFQKSEEILKDTDIMKEKTVFNSFFGEIVKSGLAIYGQKEVEEALSIGKVKTLLLSEGIEWIVIKIECTHCETTEEFVEKNPLNFDANSVKCKSCNSPIEVIEEIDYIDWMIEKAHNTSAETKIISTETPEGEQFLTGFGGIGAILRYK